jgi:hypothetical protein
MSKKRKATFTFFDADDDNDFNDDDDDDGLDETDRWVQSLFETDEEADDDDNDDDTDDDGDDEYDKKKKSKQKRKKKDSTTSRKNKKKKKNKTKKKRKTIEEVDDATNSSFKSELTEMKKNVADHNMKNEHDDTNSDFKFLGVMKNIIKNMESNNSDDFYGSLVTINRNPTLEDIKQCKDVNLMVRMACINRHNIKNIAIMEWSEAVLLQLCTIHTKLDFINMNWFDAVLVLKSQWRREVVTSLQNYVGNLETLSSIIFHNHNEKLKRGLIKTNEQMFHTNPKINYDLLKTYDAHLSVQFSNENYNHIRTNRIAPSKLAAATTTTASSSKMTTTLPPDASSTTPTTSTTTAIMDSSFSQ